MTTHWTRHAVTWTGLTRLCGSVPTDPEIVKTWLEARKPKVKPPGLSITETVEEVFNSLPEVDEASSNILVFQRQQGLCVMRAATIKAHLKDCARRVSSKTGRVQGEAAFSTNVINYVYPDPAAYWVPILRPEGIPITKHDGELDRPITTRFGTALKRFEWIEPWRLDFTLHVWTTGDKPAVQVQDLVTLMQYGGVHGYAGERGNGEGKYLATITPLKGE